MPINAACPACAHEQSVAEHLEGRKITCDECGERFVVSTASRKGATKERIQAKPPPSVKRPPRSRESDDDDTPRARPRRAGAAGQPWIWLALGGAALVFLGLLICVPGVGLLFFLKRAPAQVAHVQPPLKDDKPAPNQNDDAPKEDPPRDQDDPPKNVPPKKIKIPPKITIPPDAGPDVSSGPKDPGAVLPITATPSLIFPSTLSPFVAVQQGPVGKENWQVVDLRTLRQVAICNQKVGFHKALSPDGQLIASKGLGNAVQVTRVATNTVKTIELDKKGGVSLDWLDFGENNQLIITFPGFPMRTFVVYDSNTGQEVQRFASKVTGFNEVKKTIALSPGRKYLALANGSALELYRPLTGERLALINLVGVDERGWRGLAFSADGTELAALFGNAFGSTGMLMSVKFPGCEMGITHKFGKDLQSLSKNPLGYGGAALEWLPDGSGWVCYGEFVVDYPSGVLVYTIDHKPGPQTPSNLARRVISGGHVVVARGNFLNGQLSFLTLPHAEIAAAVKAARAGGGGEPVAAELKRADLSAARPVTLPDNLPWAVRADAAPAVKQRLMSSVAVRGKVSDMTHVLLAGADAGQAVIVSALAPNPLQPRKNLRAERYSLHDGRFLGSCALFADNRPAAVFPVRPIPHTAAVSPDGARLIMRKADVPGRLDVWNLTDGKPLVAFEPYAGRAIESFVMLDANRVITTGDGKLALWKLPECQAIYVVDGVRGAIQLSPGLKYLAASTGSAIVLLEASSGECRGKLQAAPEGGGRFASAAFTRDGTEFAASIRTPGAPGLFARWNLSTGAYVGACPGSAAEVPLAYMGKHLLHGGTLYDWGLPGAIRSYGAALSLQGAGNPDGRHWLVIDGKGEPRLIAQTLPDAPALAMSSAIAQGQVKPVMTRGTPVQFQANIGHEKTRALVDKNLRGVLEGQGFKIGPGGVTITVSAQEMATGKTVTYDLFGGGKARVNINEKKIVCSRIVTDPQGAVLSKEEGFFTTPSSITFKGNDYENQLNEAMWSSATSWLTIVTIPSNQFRMAGQPLSLPQPSALTGDP